MFLKIWAKTIKAFLSFDLSMISAGPECALTGDTMIASWANKWFITQAGIWTLLLFFITLRVLLQVANACGLASRRTKNQCTNCIIALYCLVYTTWIQACLKPFACTYRNGVPERGLERDALNGTEPSREYLSFIPVPVAECFQGPHSIVAMTSMIIIIFVVFVIPINIYVMLEKMHGKNMLSTLESKTQFGWIYLRYKVELWYASVISAIN